MAGSLREFPRNRQAKGLPQALRERIPAERRDFSQLLLQNNQLSVAYFQASAGAAAISEHERGDVLQRKRGDFRGKSQDFAHNRRAGTVDKVQP